MVRGRGARRGGAGQRGGAGPRGGRGRGGITRGRGRRRGRGGGVHKSNMHNEADQDMSIFSTQFTEGTPFDIKVRNVLVGKADFQLHYELQEHDSKRYEAILVALDKKGVSLQQVSKNRALAAAWARKDYNLAQAMLSLPDEKFHINEVLKALSLLDARRMRRALEKRLKRLESQGCKKKTKMVQLRSLFGSLEKEATEYRSATGAVIKHIKRWTRSLPAKRLEFHALHFPAEPWKKVADICHLKPEKDFPQCTWFLPHCFGKAAPPGTVVGDVGILTEDNISEMIKAHDIDYTVVRNICQGKTLPDSTKTRIACYTENVDTLLWYYEELGCPAVDEIIISRLKKGEELKMSYGKLMERMLMFRGPGADDDSPSPILDLLIPIANKRLESTRLNLESPVAVIGDMSGSMDIAIQTSNIIASLLTAICSARLVFFDNELVHPPFLPKTVEDVLKLSDIIKSRNCTCPAIGLSEYYETKEVIRTFIIATDEEENTNYENLRFSQLFRKYYHEVYPARLIFISFLRSQTSAGQMVTELKSLAPEITPIQFRFSSDRPDLTKLDNVFGLLSTQTELFHSEIDEIEKDIAVKTLSKSLENAKCL